MQFKLAIIGGGLTATAMLCRLVQKVRKKVHQGRLEPTRICIQIYEKQKTFGPGFPHSDKFVLPFHITNMCASDMGILYGEPGDFQHWVDQNSQLLRSRFPWYADPTSGRSINVKECNHYPRAIMGEYLKTRFGEALQIAQNLGLEVSLYSECEVVDLSLMEERIVLSIRTVDSGKVFSREADRVLLATGHWFEKDDRDRYFTSPWPAEKLLSSIPPGARVAVIGTSLSAIETLLTLTMDGQFIRSLTGDLEFAPSENPRRFCLYSRRGLLPKVRGRMGTRRNKYLNRENIDRLLSENQGQLSLNAVFDLLHSDLVEAYGRPIDWQEVISPTGSPASLLQGYLDDAINGDGPHGEVIWQTVLHQTFGMVREIYLNLTLEDRRRFDERYTSVFFTHAATQPSVNAEKLLALMRAGIVEVVKLGKDYRLMKSETTQGFDFLYRDSRGQQKRDSYQYIVNARGQKRSLETNPSSLAVNLLRSGTVQIEEIESVGAAVGTGPGVASKPANGAGSYKTGSIWIDPATHRVKKLQPNGNITTSNTIYAVGAITRGQIINASMVREIVEAASRIADDLISNLL
jgi:uncharacterized NAD(P)/FAD-binding protein YdhS